MTTGRRLLPSLARSFGILLLASAIVSAPACRKKPVETTPEAAAPAAGSESPAPAPVEVPPDTFNPPPAPPPVTVESIDEIRRRQNDGAEFLKTVYFDFDEAALRDDTVAALKSNAAWLKAHGTYKVVVEGHCDERGTIEYNLELGDRRARSVQDYLVSLGVSPAQLRKVTYGEERPADSGHGESSWSMNRRAEFKIE